MANINNINELAQSLGTGSARDLKNKSGPSFENALNKAIDKGQGSEIDTGGAKGLKEIIAPDFNLSQPVEIITGQTSDLLNLLDAYSVKLQDPMASLKSMKPVLEELNRTADNLLKETLKLGTSDTELKQIATQTAVTARTEYIKFQRGDYLS